MSVKSQNIFVCSCRARAALLITTLFLLSGCVVQTAMEDMRVEYEERQESAQSIIRKKYGWSSFLGYKQENKTLSEVTLYLSSDEVGDTTIDELEKITRELVAEVFDIKAHSIHLNIKVAERNETQ